MSASAGCPVLGLQARSLTTPRQPRPRGPLAGEMCEPALLGWEVASCILESVLPLARIEGVYCARGSMQQLVNNTSMRSARRRRLGWLEKAGQTEREGDSDSSDEQEEDGDSLDWS